LLVDDAVHRADPGAPVFEQCLLEYFAGHGDPKTLALL
jgi:hypothetical protein